MGMLDDAVARQRERRDPLGRLPWPVRVLGLLLVTALAVVQVVLGDGPSKLLGVLLFVAVVPAQAVATWAAWKVAQEG